MVSVRRSINQKLISDKHTNAYLVEVIGFGGRIGANNDTANMIPYIIQSIFLLVPPSLFAASIYMTLGRVMTALGPDGEACSIIRVRWLTTTFVIGDVVPFLVQASGAGFSSAGDDPKTGEIIVVMGLIIQIIFFGLFVTAAVIFHYRYRQCDHQAAHFSWRKILSMLYMASALILVRSIFRIIEYAMGSDAYPLKNEWTLYIFDSLLMSVVMLVFFIWYPPNFQTGNGRGNGGYKLSNMTGP